jgi:hypothetical protein
LIIEVADRTDVQALRQELRKSPVEVHVDAILIVRVWVDEIVGEAKDRREFVTGLRIEIGVAATGIDRPMPNTNVREAI